MCFLESTRMEESETESGSVNLLDLSIIDEMPDDEKCQDEEDPLIKFLEDALMKREITIEDQNNQIKELKTLVCSLMTQLSRLVNVENELAVKMASFDKIEEELQIERVKLGKYKGTVQSIQRILEVEDADSKEEEAEVPLIETRRKKVHFKDFEKEVSNKKSKSSVQVVEKVQNFTSPKKEALKRKSIPKCQYHSELGDCPLNSAGKCNKWHPRQICFEFKDRGNCKWDNHCKFRHPVEYKVFHLRRKSSKPSYQHSRRKWCPRKAPRTQWRSSNQSEELEEWRDEEQSVAVLTSPPYSTSSLSPALIRSGRGTET